MARGPAFPPQKKFGRDIAAARLLSSDVAGATSGWVPVGGMRPLHLVVSGVFTGTVNVHVSNDPTEPGVLGVGAYPQWGDTLEGPASIVIDAPIQWMNVRVATLSVGTVNADLMGG